MSFNEITKKISPKLKGIAKRLDGRYTSFDDDDLYQEAILELWQKYNQHKLEGKTDSYILQGAMFFLKNHIRKVYKKIDSHSVSLNAILTDSEDCTLEDVIPSFRTEGSKESLEAKLLLEDINKLLDERQKEVLRYFLEDVTVREIGRNLGISHAMVIKIKNKIKDKCAELGKEII
ncbi:MAG: sigma-70 family RNA polymerase sigma factor [Candidatus Omnitrophota bacterium]|jgi:RNA polymerase sigma factor (sigma-70 family)